MNLRLYWITQSLKRVCAIWKLNIAMPWLCLGRRTLWQNASAGLEANRTATTGQMYAHAFSDSFMRSSSVDTAAEKIMLVVLDVFQNLVFSAIAGLIFAYISALKIDMVEYEKKKAEIQAGTLLSLLVGIAFCSVRSAQCAALNQREKLRSNLSSTLRKLGRRALYRILSRKRPCCHCCVSTGVRRVS